jgi:hypothetical protein
MKLSVYVLASEVAVVESAGEFKSRAYLLAEYSR